MKHLKSLLFVCLLAAVSIGIWASEAGQEAWNNLSKQIVTAEYLRAHYLSADSDYVKAINEATLVLGENYDESKDDTYAPAYNTLKEKCDNKLDSLLASYQKALGVKIGEAQNVYEKILCYPDYIKGLKEETTTATMAYGANKCKTIIDLDDFKAETENLEEDIQKYLKKDLETAKADLTALIEEADKYLDEIYAVSDYVYDSFETPVADAKTALEDHKEDTNAKELYAAYNTLKAAYDQAKVDMAAFNDAVTKLNDALKTANAKNYAKGHEAIITKLNNAIENAQTNYDYRKNISTEVLSGVAGSLTDVYTETDAADSVAVDIDSEVKTAENALKIMADADKKASLQAAIDVANDVVKKSAVKSELETALANIKAAVIKYVDEDLVKAKDQLKDAIDYASNDEYDKLANEQYQTELKSYCTTAKAKKDTFTVATACAAYTTEFKDSVAKIVANDLKLSQKNLGTAIDAADTVTVDNNTIKATLDLAIATAKEVLDKGTSIACFNETATIKTAATTAKNDNDTYLKDIVDLAAAITAAKAVEINKDYTGIQEVLNDAIADAEAVQTAQADKTLIELEDAIDALKTASDDAEAKNAAAEKLENTIATSEALIKIMVFEEGKEDLKKEIKVAEAFFTDKEKTLADYEAEITTLGNKNSNYSGDNEKGYVINALGDAITNAITAQETMGYDDNKNAFQTNSINVAKAVFDAVYHDIDSKTIEEVNDAIETLKGEQKSAISADSLQAYKELEDSITAAKNDSTTYATIIAKIDSLDERTVNATAVITPLANAIVAANNVLKGTELTGKQLVEATETLKKAKEAIVTDYKKQFDAKVQELSDNYSTHKYIINTVQADNTAIIEKYVKANTTAIDMCYYILVLGSDKYDLADVCNALVNEKSEYNALVKEYDAWKAACKDLSDLIEKAKTVLPSLKDETAKLVLSDSINNAQNDYDARATLWAKDIKQAYDYLAAAIADAQSWSFTDADMTEATDEFKIGIYEEGKITYTRKSANNIQVGNYGTFCLPMDIDASDAQFTAVYTVADFAMYYPETTTVKLFLNKATGTVKAGTPFFAQLNCTDSIVLKNNNAEQEIKKIAESTIYSNEIKVYNDVPTSGFFTENTEFKLVWNGTFKYTSGLESKTNFAFNKYGSFKNATNIPAFRGYITKSEIDPSLSAKNINIEIDFADDATAIESIEAQINSNNANLYNVAGQRVNSNFKGVVINNGKKYVK